MIKKSTSYDVASPNRFEEPVDYTSPGSSIRRNGIGSAVALTQLKLIESK